MVYCNKFVACVKVNGRVLREDQGIVYLPFSSEYVIHLQNLNSQKSLVTISIDGENIGKSLILNPFESVDLERFIRDDLDSGYKFKFIEKIKEISEHRGDKPCDGLITIKYQFEKPVPAVNWGYRNSDYQLSKSSSPLIGGCLNNSTGGSYRTLYSCSTLTSTLSCKVDESITDELHGLTDSGITVEGEDSSQKFSYGSIGVLEDQEYSLVIQLKGDIGQTKVYEPVTVKTKITCKNCNKKCDFTDKFCSRCSSRLIK